MNRILFKSILSVLLLIITPGQSMACLIQIDFTYYDFWSSPTTAPIDTVSGSIAFDVEDLGYGYHYVIKSIFSMDLYFDGHPYGVTDISLQTEVKHQYVSTMVYPLNGLSVPVTSFTMGYYNQYLLLDEIPKAWYTVEGTTGTFGAVHGSHDVSELPVPEPSTLLLLVSGLVGLVGFGRKRPKM